MPRPSAFETHKDGQTILTQLLADPPTITYAQASKVLGISKSAISQYLKKFRSKVSKAAAAEYRATLPELVQEQAIHKVNELSLLEQNVLRLESLVSPLYKSLNTLFKDLRPDTLPLMDPRTMAWLSMTRSMVDSLGRLLDRTMRAKAEILPAETVAEMARLRTQIQVQNNFILAEGLATQFEQFLRGSQNG